MERPEFSPPTSSAGRLFDAVSALLGIRARATYEGQAACELEAVCDPGELCALDPAAAYEFAWQDSRILVSGIFAGICGDMDKGLSPGVIAARFHNTMARIILAACVRIREEERLNTVALSGGVMQNRTLLGMVVPALEGRGFGVLLQTVVPANDGGLSLGQAACALARLQSGPVASLI